MINRRSLLGLLVLLGLGAVVASVMWSSDVPIKPITSMPRGVFYSAGYAWSEFYIERAPEETGWVHLPEPSEERFQSTADPYMRGFVEAHVCGECHPAQFEGFHETAHFRTSSLATPATVLGDFSPGKNRLGTKDPNLHFELLAADGGLFQRVIVQQDGQQYEHRESIDIVTGSGNHGQTYLFWEGDSLCQLPVSYFTEAGWVNSPGPYRDGTADFGRGIGARCLDCHATYFAHDPTTFNRYDRSNFILGVTCVRCHGAGWAHVQYHQTHPDAEEAHYIANPANLPQVRANEVCAQCHSGVGRPLQASFTYRPGDPLDEYVALDMRTDNPRNDDPHAANQLLRLMKSRCFKESENMTCATCHDPHRHERGNLKLFNERCAACHEEDACHLAAEYGSQLRDRCVSCHMPSRRDKTGAMETSTGILLPLLRDHLIKGWPDVTENVIQDMQPE